MNDAELQAAAGAVAASERLVISTGAGRSKESGIPTFREAMDGLWARFDPREVATEAAPLQSAPRMVLV